MRHITLSRHLPLHDLVTVVRTVLTVRGNGRNGQSTRKNPGSALTGNALFELVIRTISNIMVMVPLTLLNDMASAHMTPENMSVVSYFMVRNRSVRPVRMLRKHALFR